MNPLIRIPEFSLSFQFLPNPHGEYGELGLSWGRVRFQFDGKDLFIRSGSQHGGFEGNLVYFHDWIQGDLMAEPGPDLGSESWTNVLEYKHRLNCILYGEERPSNFEAERERRIWINDKNIFQVGLGGSTPSVYILMDEGRGRMEIGWDQAENFMRGWYTPPTQVVHFSITQFEAELERFKLAYREHMEEAGIWR